AGSARPCARPASHPTAPASGSASSPWRGRPSGWRPTDRVPEGDTLRRSARVLHDALAGHTLHRFGSSIAAVVLAARARRLEGQRVEAVDARGKYLLVRFSGGTLLLTHLGLHGSWHLYRSSSRWRQPAHRARAVLDCGDRVAVCFAAPRVELIDARAEARHPSLATLGPDVLSPDLDLAGAVA